MIRGDEAAMRTDRRMTNLPVGAGEALADDLTLEGSSLVDGGARSTALAVSTLFVDEQHKLDHHLALGFPALRCSRQSTIVYLSPHTRSRGREGGGATATHDRGRDAASAHAGRARGWARGRECGSEEVVLWRRERRRAGVGELRR
jgi:hypothetical protein